MSGVDVEELVTNALRADAGVIALAGDRVYTSIPARPRYPLLTVTRDGGARDIVGHLDAATVFVQAWSDVRDEASQLATAALDAMFTLRGSYAEGVVTGTAALVGIGHLPDPPTGNHRFVFRHTVFAHPIPA